MTGGIGGRTAAGGMAGTSAIGMGGIRTPPLATANCNPANGAPTTIAGMGVVAMGETGIGIRVTGASVGVGAGAATGAGAGVGTGVGVGADAGVGTGVGVGAGVGAAIVPVVR